jgi:hypothetical protein
MNASLNKQAITFLTNHCELVPALETYVVCVHQVHIKFCFCYLIALLCGVPVLFFYKT